ncbi:hypothetical protein Tco_1221322 [Tanacetum coccineum]
MSKLDRFLVSECFFETFPHATSLVLEKGVPDHRPILIKESIVDYGPTPFRVFHSWLEMDGFHDLVVQTWSNDGIVDGNGFILFKKKLQNLKKVIRVWNASRKSDTYTLKKDHQNRLSLIDSKIDQGCASEEDFMKQRESLAILGDMDRLEAKDYAQKAKIKWAFKGDENTSFFHGPLKKKRRQLAIRGILKNGEWIKASNIVKEEFLVHFRNRFKQPAGLSSALDSLPFSSLSQVHRDYLELPFSRDEIKRAVWDCGGDRAPGPDSFTFHFFTTFWDTIAEDVVRFVQEFSISHEILKGCNHSFIALIPKIPNAKFVYDFRPISLIGCQYKIIGKLLANRLSNVVGDFDFEKAFDSLRWDFLDKVMEKIGFGLKINVDKSNVLGVGVSDVETSLMARFIGCGVLKLPFKYLGVPFRCNMNRCVNWDVITHNFSSKLSSWKARLLSVGGRLSLIKAVLGNLPTYFMSIYLMPVSIRSNLESMRSKFFYRSYHKTGGNKKYRVGQKWTKCLSSKQMGGLGIGSIYGLNIGLLFKWILRFLTQPLALWSRVIRSIYGQSGGVFNVTNRRPKQSTWGTILSLIHRLKNKGIDLLSICSKKLGNGESTRFWEDIWFGNTPLRLQFHRIYNLDIQRNCLIVNRIPLLPSDWSTALRRFPKGGRGGGGGKFLQFDDL